jgi:hypothetical protein
MKTKKPSHDFDLEEFSLAASEWILHSVMPTPHMYPEQRQIVWSLMGEIRKHQKEMEKAMAKHSKGRFRCNVCFPNEDAIPESLLIRIMDAVKTEAATIVEKKMNVHRAEKDETFNDIPSGRTEMIKKGEWTGSVFEYELFTELLQKINSISVEKIATSLSSS